MEHAICYISNAQINLSREQINQLLNYCQENNEKLNVHGLLLYANGNFFQVIEGEKKVITELWEAIGKDTRHYGVIQVIGQDISKGAYDGYRAEFLDVDQTYNQGLPSRYVETLKGMSPNIQKVIEQMMGNFIDTNSY